MSTEATYNPSLYGTHGPTVHWVKPPSLVLIDKTLQDGVHQLELFDLAKRVQVGRQLWSAQRELLLGEQWHERRWHGQRWLLERTIDNPSASAVISERHDWAWPGQAKGREALRHVP